MKPGGVIIDDGHPVQIVATGIPSCDLLYGVYIYFVPDSNIHGVNSIQPAREWGGGSVARNS